jgi:hypothetical protein
VFVRSRADVPANEIVEIFQNLWVNKYDVSFEIRMGGEYIRGGSAWRDV